MSNIIPFPIERTKARQQEREFWLATAKLPPMLSMDDLPDVDAAIYDYIRDLFKAMEPKCDT